MVDGKQTNKTDTEGKKTDTPVANTNEPTSEYDKALELVKRREEVSKVELEILKQKKELATNEMLSGTGGGHVDAPKVSPEKEKTNQASEFFKGTALGDAIKKTNE